MRRVVEVLGDPQNDYPVIHLTGTNGKGSTARMISALLAAHQLSVGSYTSPHLEHVTERIARNGEPIEPEEFARVMGELESLEHQRFFEERPSYFELLTAAGFAWFSQVAVDVAAVEVGLLGRWDATNVADGQVAVVTNVGKDHTNGRGDWRRRVAEEKAGIVKPGSHLVLGEPDPALLPLFEAEGPADVWLRDRDFGVIADRLALGGHVVDLRTPNGVLEDVFLPVHGAHQADNAAAAVAAVEAFFGRPLAPDVVAEAFGGLLLPGRFEVVHRAPLLVLDGAHNPDGARAAAATLADEFDVAGTRRWVLGLLVRAGPRRDARRLRGARRRRGGHLHAAVAAGDRGRRAGRGGRRRGVSGLRPVPDVGEALERAWRAAEAGGGADGAGGGGLVMVTGSLYTVGAARTACRRLGLLG